VELAPGVEGLCHNSEIPGSEQNRQGGGVSLPIGEEFDFKIIRMSEAEKRIGLSITAIAQDEEKDRLQQYQRQANEATQAVEGIIQPTEKAEED